MHPIIMRKNKFLVPTQARFNLDARGEVVDIA